MPAYILQLKKKAFGNLSKETRRIGSSIVLIPEIEIQDNSQHLLYIWLQFHSLDEQNHFTIGFPLFLIDFQKFLSSAL